MKKQKTRKKAAPVSGTRRFPLIATLVVAAIMAVAAIIVVSKQMVKETGRRRQGTQQRGDSRGGCRELGQEIRHRKGGRPGSAGRSADGTDQTAHSGGGKAIGRRSQSDAESIHRRPCRSAPRGWLGVDGSAGQVSARDGRSHWKRMGRSPNPASTILRPRRRSSESIRSCSELNPPKARPPNSQHGLSQQR